MFKKLLRSVLAVSLLSGPFFGCKEGTANNKLLGGVPVALTNSTSTTLTVASYFSRVATSGGTTGTAVTGSLPASNGGPAITSVTGSGNVINGGTNRVTVTAASAMTHLYVAAANNTVAAPGAAGATAPDIGGYYDITLPSPATSVTLDITMSQSLNDTSFNRVFSGVNSGGLVGAPDNASTTLIATVGTGDVQVSLSWDTDTDVDLHVKDPSNVEIYYGAKTSSTGGTLDLDSNAGCSLDRKDNENITWATGTAPNGTYQVRVDYWSACSVSGTTNYTVTVTAGGSTKTYSGSFTASQADSGGSTSGIIVATFTKSASGVTFSAPIMAATPAGPRGYK